MATRILLAVCLALSIASPTRAADLAAELEQLLADYEAAEKEFNAQDFPTDPTDAEKIALYKSYPRWIYLPKILALAEAEPGDKTALAASKWIIDQTDRVGNEWKPIFDAEQTAWRIIQKQRLPENEIELLSLTASWRRSAAREAFLRDMASRADLPGNAKAFAIAALAEYLAQRSEEAEQGGSAAWWGKPKDEYYEFLRTQVADGWFSYMSVTDPEPFRRESIALFRRVLNEYADVPVAITARYFRDLKTLGEKATKSLHALEHLVIGAQAPEAIGTDLDGNPLRLSDFRGNVVVLSFWFTGCGPCMAAIPEEMKLVERFRDEQFALLGVCMDSDAITGKQTADEHGMTWPSWFDGRPGAITDDYNVMEWPTFYLLDAEGKIVSKNVSPDKLAEAVDAVLTPSTTADAKRKR